MSGSIRFDRAVEFYDQTRTISPESMERSLARLVAEFGGRGRVLEVGVGTGLLALPLRERGVRVTGLDLSEPMIRKLAEKAGGAAPFPLVLGDATRMPFADGSFGGAYLRWVLHLIPDWSEAVSEVIRVVSPGGVFAAILGSYGGSRDQIMDRFAQATGLDLGPVGLDWAASDELDAAVADLGGIPRTVPGVRERMEEPLEAFVISIEEGRWSWTWSIPEDVRRRAAEQLRPWARERFGPLDVPYVEELASRWCVYDVRERRA